MITALNLGPWEACGNLLRTKREADGSGGFLVAEVPANTGHTTEKALVMAAAPEMLALLRNLIDIEGPQPGNSEWGDKARAVIAQATGEQA